MANNYEMETHEELPNKSELTKNSEPMSETSKSIVEKQQFPPKTQQSQQTTAKQTKGKVDPPMKELKKARKYNYKMAKKTQIQPTIWERTKVSESDDDEIKTAIQ